MTIGTINSFIVDRPLPSSCLCSGKIAGCHSSTGSLLVPRTDVGPSYIPYCLGQAGSPRASLQKPVGQISWFFS